MIPPSIRCGRAADRLARLLGAGWLALSLAAAAAAPKPLLNPIFADHMVLQRGRPDPIWGWAAPGSAIRVAVAGETVSAVAGPDGRWRAVLGALDAGGPYTLLVDGAGHVAVRDVLVGDVWLCGGQSNMELPLRATEGWEKAARADLPELRLCTVAHRVSYVPAATVDARWRVCSPGAAASFSAVAYYFGRKLQGELHVPIGLVEDCVGGSPAESWMSAGALARIGEFGPQIKEIARLHARGGPEYGSFLMHWLDENDRGGKGGVWAGPEFDDRGWRTVSVPGGFGELGVPVDPAIVWFRREVILPRALPGGQASISLGVIERMDTVYVNGRWVGASSWVEHPRLYPIPAGVLKPGRNVIALRVVKTQPAGGFLSPPAVLRLSWSGGAAIPLAGAWKAAVSLDVRPPMKLPLDLDNYPTMPTVLYDGMIAPIEPLAIAGTVWYQGEANTDRPRQYRRLLPALIRDWREAFGQGDFPFYIVSLPAFTPRKAVPATDGWAELRAAQAETVREVPNTGLAITIDTGEADNIHPRNKRPVGERLALCALAGCYHRDVVACGPTLRRVERRPGSLALRFDHAEGGLRVRGDKLGEFSVAGKDGVWHWARAQIEGADVVVVSAAEVPDPLVVRYAWQANPLATLFNAAGLPAAPFQASAPNP